MNMQKLTPEILDEKRLKGAVDQETYQRAIELFKDGRVQVNKVDQQNAYCSVHDRRDYRVEIKVDNNYLYFKCDCTHASRALVCEHDIAASFAVRERLKQNEPSEWQTQLDNIVRGMRKSRPSAQSKRYLLFFSLQKDKLSAAWTLLPYQLSESVLPKTLRGENLPPTTQELVNLIRDNNLTERLKIPYFTLEPAGCANCSPESVALANVITERDRAYSGYYNRVPLDDYLNLLRNASGSIFLGEDGEPLKKELQILPTEGNLSLRLDEDESGLRISPQLQLDGSLTQQIQAKAHVIHSDPVWIFVDDYVCPIQNPIWVELLNNFRKSTGIHIPTDRQNEFRKKYYLKLARQVNLEGNIVEWENIQEDPIPRLYISDVQGEFQAKLRFAYGDIELRYNSDFPLKNISQRTDSWTLLRVERQPDQESELFLSLATARYGLKRAPTLSPPGTLRLRARTDPVSFLLKMIPRLAEDGFEVYGEEELKSARVNRNTPRISFNVSSGIDWFDIKTVVNFGEIEVAFEDIRRAMQKRERYIKLVDGSIGEIPEEWFERFKHLFALGKAKGDRIRLSQHHLSLIESAMAEADQAAVDEGFEAHRDRLRLIAETGFKGIAPIPLADGFTGELRPYQKAGFDWLHFLRDFRFGGCLADDMGLGKTVQALALLHSLYHGDPEKRPNASSLLVVPRSLLVNWQREAERFTPSLHVLEYFGAKRKKNIGKFDKTDLVITTYGVMLRDIEILHGFTFHYAILDESQSIKNPLSQTSRAARLIKTRHRLALTGTPIENSTIELWSLFAFLNPGMLGNQQYFKREFVTPIERKGDKKAAETLRKLVYPYILRRTKDQVAPELPPRSDRILYSDMHPAQRKIYNSTRDYYRGLLLGMLEDQGLNSSRIKILEGLLRLRQISNHPRLVDKNFRGPSGKFELLLDTLETLRAEGHKALVFSQFVQMLSLVRAELDAQEVPYTYLDGSTHNRQEQVDTFQDNPDIPLFLISLKAGGLGLNLTAADYVIHIDPWWNPAVGLCIQTDHPRYGRRENLAPARSQTQTRRPNHFD